MFFHKPENLNHLIEQLVGLAETARRDGLLALESKAAQIEDPFMALGIQMAVDGTRPEVIEEVMRTEIASMTGRHREQKKILELIGRCGPAFGMIATLLGLVLMLGNLSDPDSIGPSMAVAFIGTLYGALMANLVCIPFTENCCGATKKRWPKKSCCAASWPSSRATIHEPCSKNSTPICRPKCGPGAQEEA